MKSNQACEDEAADHSADDSNKQVRQQAMVAACNAFGKPAGYEPNKNSRKDTHVILPGIDAVAATKPDRKSSSSFTLDRHAPPLVLVRAPRKEIAVSETITPFIRNAEAQHQKLGAPPGCHP